MQWRVLTLTGLCAQLMTDLWEKRSITYATMWTTFRGAFALQWHGAHDADSAFADTHLYIAPERPGELLSRFLDPM